MWPHRPSKATPTPMKPGWKDAASILGAWRRIEQWLLPGLAWACSDRTAPLGDCTDWGLWETLPESGSQGRGLQGPGVCAPARRGAQECVQTNNLTEESKRNVFSRSSASLKFETQQRPPVCCLCEGIPPRLPKSAWACDPGSGVGGRQKPDYGDRRVRSLGGLPEPAQVLPQHGGPAPGTKPSVSVGSPWGS